jgi:hypothetical protein
MKIILLLFLATILSVATSAQNSVASMVSEQDGPPEIISKLNLKQDQRLTNMLQRHIENNRLKEGIEGWRVEIFFVSASSTPDARDKALRVKQDFLSRYPDINVHIQFIAPDFKVRVGDFRTKSEALKLKKEISGTYPKSFEVKDIIKIPEINPGG